MRALVKHQCETCGFRHHAPSANRIMSSLLVMFSLATLGFFAARQLDGFMSIAFWVLVGLEALLIFLTIWGAVLMATKELTK